MKRVVGILVLAVVLFSLTGLAAAAEPLRVILVTDIGGLGDKGFNDGGWLGVDG